MRREEFMRELEYLLRDIPANEREDALAYYENYFDEAGAENESQVIQELGSPASVAEKILADVQHTNETNNYQNPETETYTENSNRVYEQKAEKSRMSTGKKVLIAAIIILTFPLWIGVVAGLFGGLVGIIGAAFGIVIGMVGAAFGLIVSGIALIIGGIMLVALFPAVGLASAGIGAVITAIGILVAVLCIWCLGVWLPKGIKKLSHWIKSLVHRKEGGNEI